MTHELTTIGFRGTELSAFGGDTPETTMVALKPMVEGMGLDWKTQHRKITTHPVLSKGVAIITMPTDGGPQDMVCLPLALVPGWQMTINANKVGPALRDNVIAWQTEASAVLFRHFFGNGNLPAAVIQKLTETNARLDLMNDRMAAIEGGHDPSRKSVRDAWTMAEILTRQRAAKPWRGLGTHCRSPLYHYAEDRRMHGAVQPGIAPERYLYKHNLVQAWLTDEGDQIIRAHNDAQRGQGVLQLVRPSPGPRIKPIPRLRELPPSVPAA